jgi:hypothetical protein
MRDGGQGAGESGSALVKPQSISVRSHFSFLSVFSSRRGAEAPVLRP